MPRIRQWNLVPQLGIAAVGAATMVFASSGLANAQYGPPPGPIPVPGGYDQVVTSQTVGPAGGTIGPANAGNLRATFVISAGSFLTPLQVTITEPDVAEIGNGGRPGYTAIAGVGIVIQQSNGQDYHGFLNRPLIVTLSSPDLVPGDLVVAWNNSRFVPVPGAVIHNHMVTIVLRGQASQYQYFAILSPTGNPVGRSVTRLSQRGTSAAATAQVRWNEAVFSGLFIPTAGSLLPGDGVLAPQWLSASAESGYGLAS